MLPLARYFRKVCGLLNVAVDDSISYRTDGMPEWDKPNLVATPPEALAFINMFDSGEFPELVSEPAAT